MDAGQGVSELRQQAFRLADTLVREAARTGAGCRTIDAATQMQSIAYLLGQIEESLGEPELTAV